MKTFRNARRWLLSKKDNMLILGDDTDYFYKVKHTIINKNEREVKRVGVFDVDFICSGYQYLRNGLYEYDIKDVQYNPFFISKPTYIIQGEGACTLSVNGKTMKANIGQNLTINTELLISYREDGTLMNTSVTGDYDGLILNEGNNTINITNGFLLKVIPNWRCL